MVQVPPEVMPVGVKRVPGSKDVPGITHCPHELMEIFP
jgi:hypothetical protein